MGGVLAPVHMGLLEKRGLDVDLLIERGLFTKRINREGGIDVLCIPYRRNGKVIHHKYITHHPDGSKDRLWQDKDSIKSLYNEDCLRDPDLHGFPLIITEGEHDADAVMTAALAQPEWEWEKGRDGELVPSPLRKVVSVPDGAPQSPILDPKGANYNPETPKYSYLDFEDAGTCLGLEACPVIILAVDGDAAGANLLHDLSMRLLRARCRWVSYAAFPLPAADQERLERECCKDLNEVLIHYGPAGVRKAIEGARPLKVDGIYSMSELPPRPSPVVMVLPVPLLCENWRARLGDCIIVTGIPSHGKTTVVHDFVCRLVDAYGVDVAAASFEQDPQRDFQRNLRWWKIGKHPHIWSPAEQIAADRWIDAHWHFIVPSDEDDVTLDWMLDKIEAAVIQRSVRIVIIDPWNEMDHDTLPGENTTHYTGRAIKALRRAARRLNILLIIVAHPTKIQKGADGKFRVPTLYDIADSAHWYNKSDVGIVVYRDGELSLIEVVKSRYHDDIGRPGGIEAIFNEGTRRFEVKGRPDA